MSPKRDFQSRTNIDSKLTSLLFYNWNNYCGPSDWRFSRRSLIQCGAQVQVKWRAQSGRGVLLPLPLLLVMLLCCVAAKGVVPGWTNTNLGVWPDLTNLSQISLWGTVAISEGPDILRDRECSCRPLGSLGLLPISTRNQYTFHSLLPHRLVIYKCKSIYK